jgi:hypothetical protein
VFQKIIEDVNPAKQAEELKKLLPTDLPQAEQGGESMHTMADQLDAMLTEIKSMDQKV